MDNQEKFDKLFSERNTRNKIRPYIIYAENSQKVYWDLFQSLILIYSCFITPLILAFNLNSNGINFSNLLIDLLFFLDMFVIFNTALTTEDFETIDEHKQIAIHYLKGWFWIDLIAILPIEWFVPEEDQSVDDMAGSGADLNQMVRILRVGRLGKLVKLLKLLRIFKMLK